MNTEDEEESEEKVGVFGSLEKIVEISKSADSGNYICWKIKEKKPQMSPYVSLRETSKNLKWKN